MPLLATSGTPESPLQVSFPLPAAQRIADGTEEMLLALAQLALDVVLRSTCIRFWKNACRLLEIEVRSVPIIELDCRDRAASKVGRGDL